MNDSKKANNVNSDSFSIRKKGPTLMIKRKLILVLSLIFLSFIWL